MVARPRRREAPTVSLCRCAASARSRPRSGPALPRVLQRSRRAVRGPGQDCARRRARGFIAGGTPEEAIRAALEARRAGQAFTFDVLGEACVSEAEADAYQNAYLDLVGHLGMEARQWPANPRLDRAEWGELPRVNVSVKLSALYPYLDPIDPRRSSEAVKARLRPILRAAQGSG